jgi:hypothetical protein
MNNSYLAMNNFFLLRCKNISFFGISRRYFPVIFNKFANYLLKFET